MRLNVAKRAISLWMFDWVRVVLEEKAIFKPTSRQRAVKPSGGSLSFLQSYEGPKPMVHKHMSDRPEPLQRRLHKDAHESEEDAQADTAHQTEDADRAATGRPLHSMPTTRTNPNRL